MIDERVTELEIHVAHLESAQEELGDVLVRQQAQLEALATKVERLTLQLERESGFRNSNTGEADPRRGLKS